MRFRMIAAAAASLVCAGQADAARYYEFELKGAALLQGYTVGMTMVPNYVYSDTIRVAFDTVNAASPYIFSNDGNIVLGLGIDAGKPTSLFGGPTSPNGPLFGFGFLASDVQQGATLQALNTTNINFAYRDRIDPRYSGTFDTPLGQFTSILARTSDTAPTFLGAFETLTVTAVPEPSTWALMILGVGMVGAASRRRRSVAACA